MGTYQQSEDTGMLMLESLQLDVQTLRQNREEDKQEFVDFTQMVHKNFASIQTNFTNIQTNFEKLFAARHAVESSPLGQSATTPETPPNTSGNSAPSVKQPNAPQKAIGTQIL